MFIENKYRPKERFVLSNKDVEGLLSIIRGQAIMRKETKDPYFIDKIHIYRADVDAWYITLYGCDDRRKGGDSNG